MSVEEKNPKLEIKIASPEKIRELSSEAVKKFETYDSNRLPISDGLFDYKIFCYQKICPEINKLNCFTKIQISDDLLKQYQNEANKCCKECLVRRNKCSYERMGHIELAAPIVHIWYFDVIAKIFGLKKSTFKEILRYEKNFEDIEELKNQYSDDNFKSDDDIKLYKEKIDKLKDESGAVLIRELLELFDTSYDKEISRIKNNARKQDETLKKRIDLIEKTHTSGGKFSSLDSRNEDIKIILGIKKASINSILNTEKNFEDINELKDQYENDIYEKLKDKTGEALIRDLLELFDTSYDKEISRIENNAQKQNKKLTTRLELINKIKKSGNRFTWMVLDVLPVVPPSIRPEISIDGQIFEDDLFYLYRSVISRNNKILRYENMHFPKVIIRNESRFLQQAVDALFDNDRCKEYQKKTISGRVYKGLTDKLKGKQGLFRQNLLGKRVDYSGRSVIVVGPELKLWQCGLPEDMAVELFRPHLIYALRLKSLIDDLYKNNLIDLNERVTYLKMLTNGKDYSLKTVYDSLQSVSGSEYQLPDFYETLKAIVGNHPVILNRQPSLHRLSLQAFIPVLVEGKALKLHPLMCKGFGADFDGDTMSIHVPITEAAQDECWELMLSSRNLLDPANGKTIIAPSQDMVLGIYYMTAIKPNAKGAGKYFSSIDEVRMAVECGCLENQVFIFIHKDMLGREIRADEEIVNSKYIKTSPGRLFFNEVLPKEIDFINKQLGEKELKELIEETLKTKGPQVTVKLHDALKDVGYKNATLYGASLSMADMNTILSEEQKDILLKTTNNDESKELMKKYLNLEKNQFNTVSMMVNSGARGKPEQIAQIIAMKGFIPKPHPSPEEGRASVKITASYLKGLSTFDYFQSSSGTRKDLHNTKFSTADAGYLTRRLVNAVQDVVITESDCGAAEHSVLACKCKKGLCAKCYGPDLAINQPVRIGTPVGIIAAQSIGQVFSQLVLKSKHNYGAAGGNNSDTIKEVNDLFEARFEALIKEKYTKLSDQEIIKIKEKYNNPEVLVQEIKKIYEDVDEKHIALIVRKMIQEDGTILGITKVALNSESFMAASSFQLTEKGLKEAALFGKKDEFNGITENVIPGLKIPAGTGMNGIDYFGEEAFK